MSARSYEGCASYSEYADITRPKPSKKRKILGCFTAFVCLLFWCFMWNPDISFAVFIDYDSSLNFFSQLFSVWGVKLLVFIAFSLSGIVGAILIGYYTSQPISHSPHRQRATNVDPDEPLSDDHHRILKQHHDLFNHDDHYKGAFTINNDDLFGSKHMTNPAYSSLSCNIFNND